MNKAEKQKINDEYEKKKTPYDNELKNKIKSISGLKQLLSFWAGIKKQEDYSVYNREEVDKYIKVLEDKIESEKNHKLEIENKIHFWRD